MNTLMQPTSFHVAHVQTIEGATEPEMPAKCRHMRSQEFPDAEDLTAYLSACAQLHSAVGD